MTGNPLRRVAKLEKVGSGNVHLLLLTAQALEQEFTETDVWKDVHSQL